MSPLQLNCRGCRGDALNAAGPSAIGLAAMKTMVARSVEAGFREEIPGKPQRASRAGAGRGGRQTERPFMPQGPLCAALKASKWDLAESLVTKESVLEKDNEDRLPLHLACELGAPVELVRVLLDHNDGAREELEPDCWESDVTPPRNASSIVETPFKRDCMGRLPLHYAAAAGAHDDVISMLLDYEYPPKSCATPENPDGSDPTVVRETFYGMTPADLAEKYNRDDTYTMLTGKAPTKDFFLSVMSARSSKGGSKEAAKKLEATKAKLAATK